MRFLRDFQDAIELFLEDDSKKLPQLQLSIAERKTREEIENSYTKQLDHFRNFIEAQPERIAKATSTPQRINSYEPCIRASLEVTETIEFNELQKIALHDRFSVGEKIKRAQTTATMFAFFAGRKKNLDEIRLMEKGSWDISDKSLVKNPSL